MHMNIIFCDLPDMWTGCSNFFLLDCFIWCFWVFFFFFFSIQGLGPELLKDIIGQTSGFMPRDIRALVADAGAMFVSRLSSSADASGAESCNGSRVISPLASDEISGGYGAADLCKDLSKALERSKKRNASALGTPKVRNSSSSLKMGVDSSETRFSFSMRNRNFSGCFV